MTITSDPDRLALAERLRVARAVAGLSQQYVADQIPGLNRSAVSDVERGARDVSALEAVAMATLYGVSVGELLDEPDPLELSRAQQLVRGLADDDLDLVDLVANHLRQRRRQHHRVASCGS